MQEERVFVFVIFSLMFSIFFGNPRDLLAQTEATISGTIKDPSGAVLPGVNVQVKNLETALTREGTTNENGRYRFVLLPLGNYTITASLPGFATLTRSGIRLGVGQELDVDLEMKVGQVTETVEVTEEAPIVETTRSENTQIINRRSISDLPVNGRDFTDFVLLTPSATIIPTTLGKRIAVGGGSDVTTGITVDGADYKSPFRGFQTGASSPFILSQEAVQEFEVVRAGFSAEFGRSQGGRINVVSKSGSNDFHGGGFFFFRNDSLVADDALGRKLREFKQKQFGGSVGGRIIKDKLFFFTAYDQQTFRTPLFLVLPDSLIEAAEQIVPEFKLGAQRGSFKATNDGINWFWKTDYVITPSHRVSGRFNLLSSERLNALSDPNRAIGTQRAELNDVHNVIVNYNALLGRKVNDFRFQWSTDNQPSINHALGKDFPTARINVGGQNYDIGGQPTDNDPFFQNRKQISDNFNYLFGKHDLKVGVDVNVTGEDSLFASNPRGVFTFLNLGDFLARRPASFAQFVPLRGQTLREAEVQKFGAREFAVFAQDKFRATPNLTISYGLRWEGQSNDNALTNPDFPLSGPVPGDFNNFAPRLGIAWDPLKKGKTSVRLGGGLFYARTDGIAITRVFDSNGTTGASITLTPSGPGGNLIPVFPQRFTSFDRLPPNAIPLLDTTYVDPNFQVPRSLQWTAGFEHEIARDVAVSVDFELSNTVQGNRFRNINLFPATRRNAEGRPIYDRTVRPVPKFNRIQVIESSSRATYKALVLAAQKRFSKRFQFQTSYTYSKARDDAGDAFNRVQGINAQDSFDMSNDFGWGERDIRHRFVASGVVDLPFGFSISQVFARQAGRPFNGRLSVDANSDGVFNDRPYVNGKTIPLNAFRQPRYANWDFRVLKQFLFAEKHKAEISAEFFNLTNESNFTTTNTIYGSATFGALNVPGAPFQMQIGARYRF